MCVWMIGGATDPLNSLIVDRSMLMSAGPTADVNNSDHPGDVVLMPACHVACSGATTWRALELPHVTTMCFPIIIY